MNHPLVRSLVRWGGRALALLGLLFVALRLREDWGDTDFSQLGWEGVSAIAGLSVLYGLAGVMLGLAWWCLLGHFGAFTSRWWAVRAYGLSQISKYVPGNIFHLAARQGRGMAAGIAAWPLAKSAAWEIGLLAVSGALFGILALPLAFGAMAIFSSGLLFVGAVGAVALMAARLIGPLVARAFGWQVVFLLSSGLIFLCLLVLLDSGRGGGSPATTDVWLPEAWLSIVGAYIVAWLTGLVTPGSPAGLGVREAVLLLLLQGVVPQAELLEAVVLARLVSVLGDGTFFVGASVMSRAS